MARRGVWTVVLTMICSVVMGQRGSTNIFSYADGLRPAPGIWGSSGYPAALSRASGFSAGVFGEKLYGTELAHYELGARASIGSQTFQLDLARSGSSFLSVNRASVSTGIKLGTALDLGIRLGLQYSMASGYGSASFPFAGLGMGLQLSEKCKWMVQADDLNAFFMEEDGAGYRVRTGFSVLFSPICMLAIEALATQGEAASIMASIHYHITQDVITRIGFGTGSSVFSISAGYTRKAFSIEFYSAWQLSLGASAGLSICGSFQTNKK